MVDETHMPDPNMTVHAGTGDDAILKDDLNRRICPLDHLRNDTLNEDCFKALDFVEYTSWFEYYNLGNKTITSASLSLPSCESEYLKKMRLLPISKTRLAK